MPTFASTAVEKSNAAIARSHYESYNTRDFSRTLQNCDESIEYVNQPSNLIHRGHEGVREFMGGWSAAFPDSRVQIVNVIASGTMALAEGRFRGTHEALLRSPQGDLAATGKTVDLPFCEALEIENNKIQRIRLYFDWVTVLGQLGRLGTLSD